MNFLKSVVIGVGALMLAASPSLADSWVDRYNATLNTPQAKADYLRRLCSASDNTAAFWQCERMKKNGVPNSDVRIGIVGAGLILGGAAGMAATAVPIGALGGQTLFAQWGVTQILGTAATVAVSGTAGAAVGGALAGTYAYTR